MKEDFKVTLTVRKDRTILISGSHNPDKRMPMTRRGYEKIILLIADRLESAAIITDEELPDED